MALSINNVRFRRPWWLYRHNRLFQFGICGLLSLIIAGLSLTFLPFGINIAVAAIFFYIAAEFFSAVLNSRYTSDETWFIRRFGKFQSWMIDQTRPGYYGIPESGGGIRICRYVFCDFNEIYSLNGVLLGHEQEFEDPDFHECLSRSPRKVWHFTPVKSGDIRRMPLVALWRTRRNMPAGMLA